MHDEVKDYYGKTLGSSDDLQTNACCTDDFMPDYLKPVLASIHDEVLSRYYGCGLIVPEQVDTCRVLDLGCGAGRDVYALAALVGEQGFVCGVDMTDEQLTVARRHQQFHADVFGYGALNTEFKLGYLEKLDELALAPASFDVIVSNCVINLCLDKEAVLRHAFNLLKPGGELYFSDVYADCRLSQALRDDPVLYGECLGGALYWRDFIELAVKAGFAAPRLVEDRPLTIDNPLIEEKLDGAGFYSATYRLFRADGLEVGEEDYGHQVNYLGGIDHHEQRFALDKYNSFARGQPQAVSANTWQMLRQSRFARYFDLGQDAGEHRGAFGTPADGMPFDQAACSPKSCC